MGRHKEEHGRDVRRSVRFNAEEDQMVQHLCDKYDDTPSELMRRALRYLYISDKHGLIRR